MRVAIIHYHLHPGGVTRVIENAVTALRAHDVNIVVLSGQPPADDHQPPLPVKVVTGLAYEGLRSSSSPGQLATELQEAARSVLGCMPDLWHVHNHSLGKNLVLPGALQLIAAAGQRLLLQIHDFPEDGRPANYRSLLDTVGEGDRKRLSACLYPQAGHIHYAVLNARDHGVLATAGVPGARLHWLPNAVHTPEDFSRAFTPATREQRFWLFPTRAIRRKNIGEFLLWSAIANPGDRFATTLAPQNPAERPRYERWRTFAQSLRLPVEFEVGRKAGTSFPQLVRSAHALVTTSIAEGFGMAFLEPWVSDRAITGRDLPEITQQLVSAGMDLEHLYTRLDIPLEWIGEHRLMETLRLGLAHSMHAYGRQPKDADVERALGAWVIDGRIDFGRLDEAMQEQIIRRLTEASSARTELSPARLPDPAGDEAKLSHNQTTVLRAFSIQRYGELLLTLYRSLVNSPAETPSSLAGDAILNQFLAPERLFLLRS